MPDATLTGWNRLAAELAVVREGTNPLAYAAPLNRAAEAAAVAHAYRLGRRYEPRFTYRDPDPALADRLAAFADGLAPSDPWVARVQATARTTAALLVALGRRDAVAITAASEAMWGPLDPATLAAARTRLATPAPAGDPDTPTLDAAELVAELVALLPRTPLPAGWTATVEPALGARVAVAVSTRCVKVRADARFTRAELARLVAHELAGHALRAANGALQPVALLAVPLAGYLATEEGYAVHCEHRLGVASPVQDRTYAHRVVAVALAATESFAGVYAALRGELDHPTAFELTVRVKRGLADQAAPGVFARDHVYAAGTRALTEHLATHPDDGTLLACGKVGLDALPAVAALDAAGLLAAPALTPDAFAPLVDELLAPPAR